MHQLTYKFYYFISDIIDYACCILNKLPSNIKGKILMYHHVTDKFVDAPNSCICTIERFMTQLMQLREDGYSFVSIDKALALIKNRSKEKFIVITFDDATDDMFANAFPILKNMQIPFTVYVTIDFLDKEGFISYKQLEILKDEPLCIIGSHTVSHSMLRYTDNAFDEICQSKVILESKLKKSVDHFAYPFGKLGAVSMKNIKMTKKAGYKSAVGTVKANLTSMTCKNFWYLPRVY